MLASAGMLEHAAMLTLCWICWICSVFLLRREKEVLMRLDRLARAAGSMSPATGVHVKVYLNLIICPHYMTASEIAGGVKMVQIIPTCNLVCCRMSGN